MAAETPAARLPIMPWPKRARHPRSGRSRMSQEGQERPDRPFRQQPGQLQTVARAFRMAGLGLRPFVLHRMRRLAKALSFQSSTSILALGRRISVGVSRAGCGDLAVRRRIRDRNDPVGGKLHQRGGGRRGVKLEQPMFIGEDGGSAAMRIPIRDSAHRLK